MSGLQVFLRLDGQGDVHAASVVEVDEVEVEEKFVGSVVDCASEHDVVSEDCLLYTSVNYMCVLCLM